MAWQTLKVTLKPILEPVAPFCLTSQTSTLTQSDSQHIAALPNNLARLNLDEDPWNGLGVLLQEGTKLPTACKQDGVLSWSRVPNSYGPISLPLNMERQIPQLSCAGLSFFLLTIHLTALPLLHAVMTLLRDYKS